MPFVVAHLPLRRQRPCPVTEGLGSDQASFHTNGMLQ
jgi:hypothetical protein